MQERKAFRDSQASLNNSIASITKEKDNIDKLVSLSNNQLITDLFQASSDMKKHVDDLRAEFKRQKSNAKVDTTRVEMQRA